MSSKNSQIVLGGIAIVALIAVIALAYIFITGGSGEASREIDAPTLDVGESDGGAQDASPTEAGIEGAGLASGGVLFNIISEESEVRFSLSEELGGQPNRVVGITNQVAGQLFVNFDTPSQSQVGTIRVNVRTLATDNEFRNRAIRGQILQSAEDRYEFSDFVPSRVENMPPQVIMGEPFEFTVVGNLTVRDITREITFSVLATAVNPERIEGTAATSVRRADFNLQIPSVPNVANVSEDVLLEIDFVAVVAETES